MITQRSKDDLDRLALECVANLALMDLILTENGYHAQADKIKAAQTYTNSSLEGLDKPPFNLGIGSSDCHTNS